MLYIGTFCHLHQGCGLETNCNEQCFDLVKYRDSIQGYQAVLEQSPVGETPTLLETKVPLP